MWEIFQSNYPIKLIRDPPDKAMVKHPLSFTEFSDSCDMYSAKSVASSSALSKILNSLLIFGPPQADIFAVRHTSAQQSPVQTPKKTKPDEEDPAEWQGRLEEAMYAGSIEAFSKGFNFERQKYVKTCPFAFRV